MILGACIVSGEDIIVPMIFPWITLVSFVNCEFFRSHLEFSNVKAC
jgi:hypothetical protein